MKDKKNPNNLGLPLYNLLGGYYRDPLTLTVAYYDDFDEILCGKLTIQPIIFQKK